MQQPGSSDVESGKREAVVAIMIWLATFIYTITYCSFNAYDASEIKLKLVFGIPAWVVWGVFAPWLLCIGVTAWFSFVLMKDCDLGENDPSDDKKLNV